MTRPIPSPATSLPNPFAARVYGQLDLVGRGVHIWRNIVNSGVFIGERAIAVVDTQVNQPLARRLRDRIRAASDLPLAYVINTHYHWDHTNGNQVFREAGAQIIASRRTAKAMVERSHRQKDFLSSRGFDLGPDPIPPDAFAEDLHSIDLGGLTLEFHAGHEAETADPTLVWCPEERVLCSGDTVMTGSFPIFGQPSQREGLEHGAWLTALDQVRGFHPAHVLPGHGPVAHDQDINHLEQICRYFLGEVRRHHDAGLDLPQTIKTMEAAMPAWIREMSEVWGTPRYAILRVWAGIEDLGAPGWMQVKPSAIPEDPGALGRLSGSGAQDRDVSGWTALVEQVREGGDDGAAVSLARAAVAQLPHEPGAHALLARVLVEASRRISSVLEKGDCFEAARHALDRALEIDPCHGPALLQLGEFLIMVAYRNGDDPAAGEAVLERASSQARTREDQARICFLRGLARRTQGDEASARSCFGQALALDPTCRGARLALLD